MENGIVENSDKSALMKKVTTASLIGTTLEWFDFFIFSTMAALVFNQLFFSNLTPLMGTLAALATFATGFITRPLGAVLFGHLGDVIGRKSTMIITMMLMGAATFIVGILPTYEMVGFWAPLLLILLRLIQGIGLGGEWGGAVLICVEHSPKGKRGFYGSFPQLGVPLGIILSAIVIGIVSLLPEDQFLTWGWRIPFLLSIFLILLGLFVRSQIEDTPAFNNMEKTDHKVKIPIISVLRNQPKRTLFALGTRFCESTAPNIFGIFMLAYLTQELGMSRSVGLIGQIIASLIALLTVPLAGALSDRFGRRPVYMAGAIFTGLFAFPAFWMVNTGNSIIIWIAMVLGFSIGWGLMYGPQAAFYAELFDANIRYSAIGFVYAIGALPSGAIAAAIATALLAWTGGTWAISLFLIFMAIITVISTFLLPETFQIDINRSEQSRGKKKYEEPSISSKLLED